MRKTSVSWRTRRAPKSWEKGIQEKDRQEEVASITNTVVGINSSLVVKAQSYLTHGGKYAKTIIEIASSTFQYLHFHQPK